MKKCIKCNNIKSLDDFYVRKGMKFDRLNECKKCFGEDRKRRYEINKKDPKWVEMSKERSRIYSKNSKNKYKPNKESAKANKNKWIEKFPEKWRAYSLSRKLVSEIIGNILHHWSYNVEHAKDIIELSVSEHKKLHRYLIYDQERFMYRRIDTMELLDTKESHMAYYESLKEKP